MKKILLLFVPLMFFFGCEEENECVSELILDCDYFMIWDPVCGCDGVTYANYGQSVCNNILDYTEGECLN